MPRHQKIWSLAVILCASSLLLGAGAQVSIGQYAVNEDEVPEAHSGDMPHEAVDLSQLAGEGGMESLLHWAISNSDPQELRRRAEQATQDAAVASLQERRNRVKELIDIMNQQPSETSLIKEAIAVLTHPDSGPDEHSRALMALQILSEPIDNANDLKPLGGLPPILAALVSSNSSVQAAAAYVIGTAASNNPKFQLVLLNERPDIFQLLLQRVSHGEAEVVVKSLYAVAAMVRNQDSLRQAFFSAGGLEALQVVLAKAGSRIGSASDGSSSRNHRAQRKAVALLIDLVHLDSSTASALLDKGIPAAITSLLAQPDSDLQEKALDAMQTLLRSPSAELARQAFKAVGAGSSVEKLHDELLAHLREAAGLPGESDDHYHKYLLGLVQEVQRGLAQPAPLSGRAHTEL